MKRGIILLILMTSFAYSKSQSSWPLRSLSVGVIDNDFKYQRYDLDYLFRFERLDASLFLSTYQHIAEVENSRSFGVRADWNLGRRNRIQHRLAGSLIHTPSTTLKTTYEVDNYAYWNTYSYEFEMNYKQYDLELNYFLDYYVLKNTRLTIGPKIQFGFSTDFTLEIIETVLLKDRKTYEPKMDQVAVLFQAGIAQTFLKRIELEIGYQVHGFRSDKLVKKSGDYYSRGLSLNLGILLN